jgi:pimeloyl-ACP methyl ester carboxylesterase
MQTPPEELPVRADGTTDAQALSDVAKHAVGGGATDVLILAHGWNETRAGAAALYTRLCDGLGDRIMRQDVGARTFTAVGVVWPSLRWADLRGLGSDGDDGGGGASVGEDVLRLHRTIGATVDDAETEAELRALTTRLDTPAGRAQFVETLRRRLPAQAAVADDDALPGTLAHGDPEELFAAVADAGFAFDLLGEGGGPGHDQLTGPGSSTPPGLFPDLLDPGGGAALFGFPDLSPLVVARRLINVTSYYTMKDRSGLVGAGAVARLVEALHALDPDVRVHLAGHSFGARVMASAATACPVPVHSLTLLQGAFSHVGFAPAAQGRPAGAFRRALTDGVTGPVVVTHTHRDRAVTFAYAIASRIARQATDALGGPDDPYGGIGANGAVRTPEAVRQELGAAGTAYAFEPGRIHNLRADRFVTNHLDIRGEEISNALLQAMLTQNERGPTVG